MNWHRLLPACDLAFLVTMMIPVVTDNAQAHRYEISVDGVVAGFIDYHDHGDRRTLIHTEIGDAYEGQGLGSRIVRAALEDIRNSGKRVRPECPFVRAYLERHPEYVDLVD